ncbi:chloride channel protein, CIC family [Marchantia polymorpha subsp. ruderalis]|uniref:Chloride channel protein n=2 Tax=Marchantia polymorpha TaxID=3197 RepID=A0A176VID7_MARPO|nr:hypothetical protein AXG93_3818s1200 [Marchantia polymorpha subsp. ruderalis]PTQ50430.1 hypothetical protein MARPO_0001s0400 [Marchantia polymorpha]BBM99348.1 hypothetical protein Mp_1g20640 [Marchantia polymorpha subsp. ruderalis]|eukprot:PTQ50430.1 hypothetical protein MARPO_0001s0400 [Marchantia polymorpha]
MQSARLPVPFLSRIDYHPTERHGQKRSAVLESWEHPLCLWSSAMEVRLGARRQRAFARQRFGNWTNFKRQRANPVHAKRIVNEKRPLFSAYIIGKIPGEAKSGQLPCSSPRNQRIHWTEAIFCSTGIRKGFEVSGFSDCRPKAGNSFAGELGCSVTARGASFEVSEATDRLKERKLMPVASHKMHRRRDSADKVGGKSRSRLEAVADDRADLKEEEGEEEDDANSTVRDDNKEMKRDKALPSRKALGSLAATAIQESLPPEGFVVLMSCAVGLLTGVGVVAFNLAVHEIHDIVFEGIPGSGAAWLRDQPFEKIWQQILIVPVGGGVVVGLLNTVRSSLGGGKEEQSGSGDASSFSTNVKAVGRQLLKTIAAAVTLGTGNSLGPEGPSVEIGASIANGVGTLLNNSRERKLSLVASGSAAGISSGFNAAVAGCFFAVESVLRQASVDSAPSLTTAMVLLSSVLASVVSQAGLGSDPAFRIPPYDFRSPTELPLYLLLGILCGLVSVTLTKGTMYATASFEWLQKTTGLPSGFLPPIGGLCVGLVALKYPEVLYWGFANVDVLLESQLPWVRGPPAMLLIQLVGVKVLVTSICRGSGLVGGVYAPSLFIGAALGSAYGKLATYTLAHADPSLHLESLNVAAPQAYALVGMAAMLAGVCQVPLTAVLLLFELTRDYRIILPLMAAVGLSSWVASTFQRKRPRNPIEVSLPAFSNNVPLIVKNADPNAQPVELVLTLEPTESSQSLTTPLLRGYVSGAQELCDLEDSLCLSNLEVNEERLTDEIPVGVAMRTRYAALVGNTSVQDAMRTMLVEKEWCVIVVNEDNNLEGILTLADIQQEAENFRRTETEDELDQRPISALCRSVTGGKTRVVTVYPDMSLTDAQRRMARRGLRQLPVIARTWKSQGKQSGNHVVGLLDRESIKLACRVEATRRILGLPATVLTKLTTDDINASN